MRTDPDILEIVKGPRGMLRGIQVCVKNQCLVSAVALIYSCIDSLAALTRPTHQKDTTRTQFIDWVNTYLLPESFMKCAAEDLYGARCGILHTYSPDSLLRRNGHAKPLVYCWKSGPAPDAEIPMPPDAIVITVEDLMASLERAIIKFLLAIDSNPSVKSKVDHHRKELLCYKPYETITIHVAA